MDSPLNRRIHGIDFSGAQDAAERIWIASGDIEDERLEIKKCRPAAEEFETSERDETLNELRKFIAGCDRAVFGLDFSFGVPSTVTEDEDWFDVVRSISERDSPRGMQKSYSETARDSDADGVHLKRATDEETEARSPYGFITFRQTYYGVKHVLKPLLGEESVSVLPMQERDSNRPWVLEVYPASTLRDMDSTDSGYKEQTVESRSTRTRIVQDLAEAGVDLTNEAAQHAQYIDDALDSLVAAFATFRAIQDGPPEFDETSHPEGRIYV